MGSKDYKNLEHYILDGFARLLDLGYTRGTGRSSAKTLEEDIYMTIKDSWQEVGDNFREAMNQYGRE